MRLKRPSPSASADHDKHYWHVILITLIYMRIRSGRVAFNLAIPQLAIPLLLTHVGPVYLQIGTYLDSEQLID